MMRHDSDGVDVVRTQADADRLDSPPLLILESVVDYLDSKGLGSGPLAWQRIGDGQSNVTFLIRRRADTFVLRRGPRPPLPRTAHDMVREARIQLLLRPLGTPVPQVFDVCEDESVLGVPFYTMSFVEGVVLTDSIPAFLQAAGDRRRISESTVDALVELHSIDATAGELSLLGRPDGYLQRQMERFGALWPMYTLREVPGVQRVGDWLAANIPQSQTSTVVHGDYRLGNLMFDVRAPIRVSALLDWEMATLGDPLADLGYLTATYAEPGSFATIMELSPVTREPGFLRRAEVVKRYGDSSDLDLDTLPWYQALALWKAAIFSEAIYTRWLQGERPDDTTFAPALEEGVPRLIEGARRFVGLEGFDAFERTPTLSADRSKTTKETTT